eukprot:scaffold16083_cov90-Isochrysis_galbana.AAC.2
MVCLHDEEVALVGSQPGLQLARGQHGRHRRRPIQHDEAQVLRALGQLPRHQSGHHLGETRVLVLAPARVGQREQTREAANVGARVRRLEAGVVVVEDPRLPPLIVARRRSEQHVVWSAARRAVGRRRGVRRGGGRGCTGGEQRRRRRSSSGHPGAGPVPR